MAAILDILITHAPPRGIHDAEDLPHQGFESYLSLLRGFRPTLMIHGHQHVYNRNEVTETDYEATRIINTYGYRVLELAQRQRREGVGAGERQPVGGWVESSDKPVRFANAVL